MGVLGNISSATYNGAKNIGNSAVAGTLNIVGSAANGVANTSVKTIHKAKPLALIGAPAAYVAGPVGLTLAFPFKAVHDAFKADKLVDPYQASLVDNGIGEGVRFGRNILAAGVATVIGGTALAVAGAIGGNHLAKNKNIITRSAAIATGAATGFGIGTAGGAIAGIGTLSSISVVQSVTAHRKGAEVITGDNRPDKGMGSTLKQFDGKVWKNKLERKEFVTKIEEDLVFMRTNPVDATEKDTKLRQSLFDRYKRIGFMPYSGIDDPAIPTTAVQFFKDITQYRQIVQKKEKNLQNVPSLQEMMQTAFEISKLPIELDSLSPEYLRTFEIENTNNFLEDPNIVRKILADEKTKQQFQKYIVRLTNDEKNRLYQELSKDPELNSVIPEMVDQLDDSEKEILFQKYQKNNIGFFRQNIGEIIAELSSTKIADLTDLSSTKPKDQQLIETYGNNAEYLYAQLSDDEQIEFWKRIGTPSKSDMISLFHEKGEILYNELSPTQQIASTHSLAATHVKRDEFLLNTDIEQILTKMNIYVRVQFFKEVQNNPDLNGNIFENTIKELHPENHNYQVTNDYTSFSALADKYDISAVEAANDEKLTPQNIKEKIINQLQEIGGANILAAGTLLKDQVWDRWKDKKVANDSNINRKKVA